MKNLQTTGNQKSFYNKAKESDKELYSYGTLVASISPNGSLLRHWDGYSGTTMRHINAFAVQHGLSEMTKAQWLTLPVVGKQVVRTPASVVSPQTKEFQAQGLPDVDKFVLELKKGKSWRMLTEYVQGYVFALCGDPWMQKYRLQVVGAFTRSGCTNLSVIRLTGPKLNGTTFAFTDNAVIKEWTTVSGAKAGLAVAIKEAQADYAAKEVKMIARQKGKKG